MKKTVTIKARHTVEQQVEIEFPIYSRHDIDGDGWSHTIFMRRDADGIVYSVKQDATHLEVEIRKYSLDGNDVDYILGRGEFESSAAEFFEALSAAKKFLAKVPEQP